MNDLERLKKLYIDLGVDEKEIKNESSFVGYLGLDSLKIVQLVMSIEDEFGVEIPDETSEHFKTVQDVIDYLSVHKRI